MAARASLRLTSATRLSEIARRTGAAPPAAPRAAGSQCPAPSNSARTAASRTGRVEDFTVRSRDPDSWPFAVLGPGSA